MQAGDIALAEEVHAIEPVLDELGRDSGDRTAATAAVVERIRAVERALASRVGPGVARDVDLEQVADAARAEALRAAARRDVRLSVEVIVPRGARVPRRIAGVSSTFSDTSPGTPSRTGPPTAALCGSASRPGRRS